MKLIDVSSKGRPNTFAMVDDEDFDRINAHKWFAWTERLGRLVYGRRGLWVNGESIKILMHREVLGQDAPRIIDHIDGNGLNNQKSNLRPATYSQNIFNSRRKPKPNKTSKYRGVGRVSDKVKLKKPWYASIGHNYKTIRLGYFPTEELAYAAYLAAARRIYGEFMPSELTSGPAFPDSLEPTKGAEK